MINSGQFSKGCVPWNAGLTAKSDERVCKFAEKLQGKKLTKKHKKNMSIEKKHYYETHDGYWKGEKFSLAYRKKLSVAHKSQIPWNKNKQGCFTKETRKKMSSSHLGKRLSKETKDKMSITKRKQIENGLSINTSNGCHKHGWYKGYWCDSSWELAWIVYNLDNGIEFKRNKQGFPYTFNDKIHQYFPDFVLSDGTFVEIKGRSSIEKLDNRTLTKIKAFPYKFKLLLAEEMKPIIDYCKEMYGNDYCHVYDKNLSMIICH